MTQAEFYCYQEQTFDSYVKALIRNESIDARRGLARQAEREISLSDRSYDHLAALSCMDRYRLEELSVHMTEGTVVVFDRILGQAILSLAPKWRDVIVMYYFLDLSDEKIGCILHYTEGAIRHRRKVALDRLKAMLEDMGYEK